MKIRSVPTRGRTLDHAAPVYDVLEPLLLLGKQKQYDNDIISQLDLSQSSRVLDLGCGTGILTRMIADRLKAAIGGQCTGIDAAAKMIQAAQKKRASKNCFFKVMAAEELSFPDHSFDAVVSSLFFHHVPLDLKEAALHEAYRVLKPGGRLVIADMHIPKTFMGWLVSHTSRWFFLQPQIGENISGILPELITQAGFTPPVISAYYFGYIALFSSTRQVSGNDNTVHPL
ncbi:MAG: methyltransferase domain-containing protein [Desulfopila sp.]|jgi:ubiquinone/menaquinone biosynthesis C-methylase UbiE|nr:methyltransferase domain-containing protein [Desulfopila sp.]